MGQGRGERLQGQDSDVVPVPQRCGPAGHSTSQQARHGLAERPTGEGGLHQWPGIRNSGPRCARGPAPPHSVSPMPLGNSSGSIPGLGPPPAPPPAIALARGAAPGKAPVRRGGGTVRYGDSASHGCANSHCGTCRPARAPSTPVSRHGWLGSPPNSGTARAGAASGAVP